MNNAGWGMRVAPLNGYDWKLLPEQWRDSRVTGYFSGQGTIDDLATPTIFFATLLREAQARGFP